MGVRPSASLGFFLSLLNYVNSRAGIKRDIRVEGAHLHQAAGALKGIPEHAHLSRTNVMAAIGMHGSGNMQRFADQYVTDTIEAARLEREVAAIDKRLNWVRFAKLSDRLTLMRQLENDVGVIRENIAPRSQRTTVARSIGRTDARPRVASFAIDL